MNREFSGWRLAAAFCLTIGLVTAATLLPALFDPPPWNRVQRALEAAAWFYVGYLHWRLARVEEREHV